MIQKQPRPTLWQMICSVCSAFLGVQSSAAGERDAANEHFWWAYVCIALVLVLLFVLTLVMVAKFLMQETSLIK